MTITQVANYFVKLDLLWICVGHTLGSVFQNKVHIFVEGAAITDAQI